MTASRGSHDAVRARPRGTGRWASFGLAAALLAGCAAGAKPATSQPASPLGSVPSAESFTGGVQPSSAPTVASTAVPFPSASASGKRPSVAPTVTATPVPAPTPTLIPSAVVGTKVGDRAPDIALRDIKGKPVSLQALRGRPVWLLFWAPGCVSCEPTLVEANLVQAENAASKLAVVSVAVYTDPREAEAYASALALSYPVALDEDGQVFARYRAVTLPVHVWIDRDGIIRDWAEGDVPPELVTAAVAKITGR